MLLWFAGGAVVVVWAVLRDPAVDYRLLVAGALLPEADAVLGGARQLHTLAAAAAVLVAVMLATRGRRSARRRALAVPFGMLVHLVLDGVWGRQELFWWPAFGLSLAGEALPSLDRPWPVLAAQELAGAAAVVWAWRRFRLGDPDRRAAFLRTGRFGRHVDRGCC